MAVRRVVAVGAALTMLCGCGAGEDRQAEVTIGIVAPFSRGSYAGETIDHGAALAVARLNQSGGIRAGGSAYTIRLKRYDTALSPARAVASVRRAVSDGAVAVLDEGTGVNASWTVARDASLPQVVVYQGGVGLVDPERRPNVFRIAPTDRGIAFRLAEYIIPKGAKVALLTDDSGYGQEGRKVLAQSFGRNPEAVAGRITLPSSAPDLSPQILEARRAGATALLVWAQAATLAKAIGAARSARWGVPVYTTPQGEDPLVRQQLAAQPEWVDGLTFASGRMTAEVGPAPWNAFQFAYEASFGPQFVGVRTRAGKRVVQPPDYAMYAYDAVNVIAGAIVKANGIDRDEVLAALEEVTVDGANGDERGFNEASHEGVVDDDVYFARFHDMTFRPVKDDPLSSTLPTIPQAR